MSIDWKEVDLGSVVEFSSGGTPSKANESFWGGELPWLSAKDMKSLFVSDTEDHLTEAGASNGTRTVAAGTVFLLTRGMTLLNDIPICVAQRSMAFNQDVKALRAKEGLLGQFLPYLLLGNKRRLHSLVDLAGHGTGRLNTDQLKAFPVILPSPAEQEAIAETLGALDDKIELNRKMNTTLDELARTIFRSWFVDFDPVRAKTEGREPFGMDAETAALFPDRFTDSELGPIPERWEIDTFENLTVIAKESVSPSKTPDTEYAHYSIPAFDEGRMPVIEFGSGIKSNKTSVPERAVLLSKLNPRIPRVWLALAQEEHPAIASTEFIVLLPSQKMNRSFVYGMVSSGAFFDRFASLVSGTSGSHQRVRPRDFQAMETVVPDARLIAAYETVTSPLLDLIQRNLTESSTLAQLRDTLLPELISGRIRVPEAERAVAEVV